MMLSLFGCGCSDTSGTPDADMGMNGNMSGTRPTDGGIVDDTMDNVIVDEGALADQAGDDVVDGDNYDTAHTDSAAGNSAGDAAGNNNRSNSAMR